MEPIIILLIQFFIFVGGMVFVKICHERGEESWISGLIGYAMAVPSASLFINYSFIALGADNSNDIFIGSIIVGILIAITTPKLLFK